MSDWVPLDEKELLEDDGFQDNNSPQEQGPGRLGSFGADGPPPAGSAAPTPPPGPRREITRDMVLRALEKQGARRRNAAHHLDDSAAEDRFLAAQSHLHLNGRGINKIANLRQLTTLEVLYLYDNQISVIENVSSLRRLTHLYLANNCIREITGLAGLHNLQKLYLEQNCLQTISGLEACPSLEELHVSSQRLAPGSPGLTFHPASVAALAASLRVLTASHCGITSATVTQIAGLSRLRRLDLSHNELDAFEPLDSVVAPCPLLSSLDLRGNPLTRMPKYRDTVILMNDSLTTLDEEQISPQHREFLLRLHIRRMKAQLAAEIKEEAQGAATAAAAAPPQGYGDPPGYVPAPGVTGSSRVPPRTGGFHPSTHGSQPGSGAVSRNTSMGKAGPGGSRGAGAGRAGSSGVQGLTRGMDGLGLHR